MGAAIPGNPSIVVQNMSGAGSNRAAGYIYSVAPKDGTAIGAIFPGAVLQPLLSDQPVPHDPSKLVYLGSANSDVYVCYVRSDAPVKSFMDVFTQELIIGASNPGATTYDLPLLLNNVLGAKFRSSPGIPAAGRSRSRSNAARSRARAASAGPESRRCIPNGSPRTPSGSSSSSATTATTI